MRLSGTTAMTMMFDEKCWLPFLLSGAQFQVLLKEDTKSHIRAVGLKRLGGA